MHRTDIDITQCLFRKCIMNTEFNITINDSSAKVYMQVGFFNHADISYPIHKHIFSEMHVFLNGNAVLKCDSSSHPMQKGDVFYIPAGTPHVYQSFDKDSKRISFFIDCEAENTSPKKTSLPKSFLDLLCEEIQAYVLTGKDGQLKALLSYICSSFFVSAQKKPLLPIANRELIIDEFFSQNYNKNVTLDNLAKELMLSKKQTEREIKRVTGNTFVGELSKRRIDAAIILSQTTALPLSKISELVGYTSYCGFYKAYRRVMNLQ